MKHNKRTLDRLIGHCARELIGLRLILLPVWRGGGGGGFCVFVRAPRGRRSDEKRASGNVSTRKLARRKHDARELLVGGVHYQILSVASRRVVLVVVVVVVALTFRATIRRARATFTFSVTQH